MGTNDYLQLMPEMAAFVRVVDCGSFSAAARELGVTPSALSRQVARLERALSLRLLERSTRKLRLSEAGAEAYRRCVAMVAAARATMDLTGEFLDLPQGLLRVAVPKAFAKSVVGPLVAQFLRAYPDVALQLLVNDFALDPLAEDADLVIRITEQPPEGLVARALMPVRQLLCAAPAYLAAHGTPQHPRELAQHQCLYLGEHAADSQWRLRRGAEVHSVTVHGRYIVNHSELRLDGVVQGFGIGCLPHFTVQQALARGDVVQVLADWDFVTAYQGTAYALYLPNRHLAPKVRVFIDYLVAQLQRADA